MDMLTSLWSRHTMLVLCTRPSECRRRRVLLMHRPALKARIHMVSFDDHVGKQDAMETFPIASEVIPSAYTRLRS